MVEENEFFRNAALKLCGSLVIHEGLRACIEYIALHMPADTLFLERHEPHLGAMRIVARAGVGHGCRMDKLVPYSDQAKVAMGQLGLDRRADMLKPVLVVNNSRQEPITRCMLEGLGEPVSSVMSLPFVVEGKLGGALALLARGNDRFDARHARLFATLREPFFVAMSNTLQHEEVERLKNRLADEKDSEAEVLELDVVVERHIRRALARTDGKIHGAGGAAELLGLNPNTLRSRMRKLGIPFRRQRT